MGGHGGLNILPQKRWNVYNRDNRLKVARDEAKHAAQEAELQAKHRAAEAEARRKLLLERAKERRAEVLQDAGLSTAAEQVDEPSTLNGDDFEKAAPANGSLQHLEGDTQYVLQQQLQEPQTQQQPWQLLEVQQQEAGQEKEPVLEHINFWKDLEAKAEHPDRKKEKKDEKRQRGNPDTYTTDARFDASFQLGHGLTGPKPWYARAADPTVQQQWEQGDQHQQRKQLNQPQQQQQHMLALPANVIATGQDAGSNKQGSKRRRSSSSSSGTDSGSTDSNSSGDRSRKRTKHKSGSSSRWRSSSSSSKKSKHKKSRKKDKRKSSHRLRKGSPAAAVVDEKALALARLRAERLEREAAERHRALVATGQMPAPNKRYNSSYGYADALKAGNMGSAGFAAARGAATAAVHGLGQRFK